MQGFLAFHGLAVLACGWAPGRWMTWLGLLLAAHGVVMALVLQPRNRWFGANLTRLPPENVQRGEVAITFDDGPDPVVTPQVLDLLDQYTAKASFFVVGRRVQQHPELARHILVRGHRLENHSSHHHALFSLLSTERMAREIMALQDCLVALPGPPPGYFRPPAGFHSPLLVPLLRSLGLHLATWTRRGFDTRVSDTQRVLRRLTRHLAAGDILLLHDGNAARDASGQAVVLRVLPLLLSELQRRGLRAVALPSPDALRGSTTRPQA